MTSMFLKRPMTTRRGAKRKKIESARIDFSFCDSDPIIDHLKQYAKSNTTNKTSRLDTTIIDHIALEGLSGITLRRLFRIIEVLYPSVPCTRNEDCQSYIWSLLVNKILLYPSNAGVKVYFLDSSQRERTNEVNSSLSKGVVIDKQIKLPTQTVKRIAKSDSLLSPVQDGSIMGSCANYLDRVDITDELLELVKLSDSPLNSMYALHEKYDLNTVYFVANQTLRAKAILPEWADPNVDIKLREYCALELIGRSRTLGTVFPNDKALGRYRIMLEAKGFITQYQENMSSPIEHHLRRFSHVRQAAKDDAAAKPKSKSKSSKNKSNTKYDNVDEDDGDIGNLDDDIEYDEEDDDNLTDKTPLSVFCCNPSKLRPNRSILTMVYDVIADSNGITQMDIRKELHLPKFHVRNHLKNLISLKMIRSRSPKEGESAFRIFTAHKSRKRKKRAEEDLAKPIGIMASWDETDLRAKKIIGHKRSSFSQAEDSLLILCRIASVLIEPQLKLSWCVNKRLVRDLLHKELVEAHDKTSDACLRRIKYLKRLPNNIMSINELMAELQDDGDIRKLLKSDRFKGKVNRRFIRVLRCVRTKIPNLLGIASPPPASLLGDDLGGKGGGVGRLKNRSSLSSSSLAGGVGGGRSGTSSSCVKDDGGIEVIEANEINDHEELKQKYELLDCQSVASIQRAPTYDSPKNVVDVKFNNASLVTMAFTLSGCLNGANTNGVSTSSNSGSQEKDRSKFKRNNQWLLDKFYSNYHDKLISSVLSKLNKRSLLTRKCSADQASLYKPRSKMSLKLNQSVLFLLNRYHSHSLIQLAHPISRTYKIELSESNEMASIALLTSLCALSSFNLDMKLKIPPNVVGIDQGNENFRSLCDKANEGTREILARFMSRCGESFVSCVASTPDMTNLTSPAPITTSTPQASGEVVVSSSGSCSKVTSIEELLPVSSSFAAAAAATTEKVTAQENCERFEREESNARGSRKAATIGELGDTSKAASPKEEGEENEEEEQQQSCGVLTSNKMDDSRRALFLLRHELKAHALDKCGSLADCLIVQPCNVKFYSDRQVEHKGGPLEKFLEKSKPIYPNNSQDLSLVPGIGVNVAAAAAAGVSKQPLEKSSNSSGTTQKLSNAATAASNTHNSNWWVKSYRFEAQEAEQQQQQASKEKAKEKQVDDLITGSERDSLLEATKRPVEFEARLWKQIDGSVDLTSLFKLIESLLSWTIVFPGVELSTLQHEFSHLMPEEHLFELLELMEELELVSSEQLQRPTSRARLFGSLDLSSSSSSLPHLAADPPIKVYETAPSAYVRFCQLLNYCCSKEEEEEEEAANES